jgi:hypothetical protein
MCAKVDERFRLAWRRLRKKGAGTAVLFAGTIWVRLSARKAPGSTFTFPVEPSPFLVGRKKVRLGVTSGTKIAIKAQNSRACILCQQFIGETVTRICSFQ